MEIKGKLKSFGANVLGQWRNYGNHTAARHINTVYAVYKIKTWPPGKFVSAFFLKRNAFRNGRITDTVPMVLIGTSATKKECADWTKDNLDNIFECIPITQVPSWVSDGDDKHRNGRVDPGTYKIKIEELVYEVEVLKRSFADLAVQYECSYGNIYAKYTRHKKRLENGHASSRDNRSAKPMDINDIHYEREQLGKSWQQLAVEYETSYQNIYLFYKRHKSKLGLSSTLSG